MTISDRLAEDEAGVIQVDKDTDERGERLREIRKLVGLERGPGNGDVLVMVK